MAEFSIYLLSGITAKELVFFLGGARFTAWAEIGEESGYKTGRQANEWMIMRKGR